MLELDLQLTLLVLRHFSSEKKKDGSKFNQKFNYLATKIVTYAIKTLARHQTLYSNVQIKMNKDLFKNSS